MMTPTEENMSRVRVLKYLLAAMTTNENIAITMYKMTADASGDIFDSVSKKMVLL